MKHAYLMRHAETPPRPGSPSEGDGIGITEPARREACLKGRLLKRLGVKKIVTSPLLRARETAEELAKESGAMVTEDDRAKEFVAADVGPPDFKTLRDKARAERDWAGERGESFTTSLSRLKSLLDSVEDKTCVVSHELLMQNLLLYLGAKKAERIEPLTILMLEDRGDGWRVTNAIPGRSVWQKIAHRIFG